MIQNVSDKSYCGSRWKKFDGSCYYFEVNQMTWIEARLSCDRRDSDLVIINSDMEQEFIHSKTGDDLYWIGLEKITDVWTWVDGTILKASSGFWGKGEPNNGGGNEKCTQLTPEGKMNDAPCDNAKYKCRAICEKK
ncbi:hepatic lectin [Xenopus laevis]|uniref:Hepatic lectin n=1 Tax=Xenopus laevis TaxID=8355 RepID=A0A8J0UTF1_XENLA|nr:hepatic lectin [Xenopus laevis]